MIHTEALSTGWPGNVCDFQVALMFIDVHVFVHVCICKGIIQKSVKISLFIFMLLAKKRKKIGID